VAYCALFLLLAVLTRNAVVIGLIYALVWETLIGSLVPGAQALSIQQWALALTRVVVGDPADALEVTAAVRPEVALPLLAVVTVGATVFAGSRLRSLRLTGEE
jgi:ABC-2 type transport system permease protein